MPLTSQEADYLLEQLYATAEVLNSDIKPAAANLMIRDLRDCDCAEVEQALGRCRAELTGRLSLAAILERVPSLNAHLSANEAWAKALETQDENATVIWTDEISRALGVAQPVLDLGDKIGARMAFIAAYEREIAIAKTVRRAPRWWPSLGDSKQRRRESIEQGIKDGRLYAPRVEHLLPAPDDLSSETAAEESVNDHKKRASMIEQLRGLLEENNRKSAKRHGQERAGFEQRRRDVQAYADQRAAGSAGEPIIAPKTDRQM